MKALFLLLAAAFTVPAFAQADWPEFRGSTGQGLAEKAPKKWGKKEGVTWRIPVEPQGWSSPVVSQGIIVLTGALEKGSKTHLMVSAFDFKTGKELWSKPLFTPSEAELAARHAKNSLASSTPVIRDGIVYAHFGHMGTAALKLESGETLWSTKVEYQPRHGGASSPILVGELLVFSADGETEPVLMALQAKTGKVAWKTPRTSEVKRAFSFATPLLVKDGGRDIIVSPASGMVGGYDPKDGKEVWKLSYKEGFSVVPRPVEMDGLVYIGTGFAKPQCLAVKLDGAEGDVSDSHVVWRAERKMAKTPSYIACGGALYVLSDTGDLTCFDARSGKIRWQERLIGNFSSSPVHADGTLYCQTEDGVCYVVRVSPDKADVIHEIDMEERIFASPAVVDGALLMRTETHLWKIGG